MAKDLDYAPPHDADAETAAAVGRVAWWSALAWAAGVALWFGPTLWQILADDDPWGAVGWGYTLAAVGLLACAAGLLIVRVAGLGRAAATWLALAGVACVLGYVAAQTAANSAYGGATLDGQTVLWAALVWATRSAGLAMLLALALWPGRLTPARLALLVAALLAALVLYHAITLVSVVVDAADFADAWDNLVIGGWIIEHARHGLVLAAATALILAAASAHRRRWPLVLAGAVALSGHLGGASLQYTVGFWGIGVNVADIASAAGAELVIAAPAAGLLAWRAPPGGRRG